MTYSTGTVVKSVAGRLALDFINTADWTETDTVLKDRIQTLADLLAWQAHLGLPDASWMESFEDLHAFRKEVRMAIIGKGPMPTATTFGPAASPVAPWLRQQSLRDLIVISALSVLADPRELDRVKLCPGHDCGWVFLDETKNARRKWCLMEVCGNRAKSSRHYARKAVK